MNKPPNIFVRLSEETDKAIRKRAKTKKTTISKLARSYIEQGLDQEK